VKTVGVAIVGAGLVSDSHAEGYLRHKGAELVAVCDTDRDVADAKAQLWKASKAYTEFDEMLKDPRVDAVDIMTPPFLHREMAIKAAEAGKHVNCEKPFCASIGEGREIVEAATRHGIVLAVDETYLFMASHVKARALIEAGAIGEPRQIRHDKGSFIQREEGALEKRRLVSLRKQRLAWRGDPVQSGGGVYPWVFDHAVHLFATTRYLMLDEAVESVSGTPAAYSGRAGGDVYTAQGYRDIPIIAWQFKDPEKQGLWVHAERRFQNAYNHRAGFTTAVMGTRGTIEVLGEGGAGLFHEGRPVHLILRKESGEVDALTFDEGGDRIWQSEVSYYDQAHVNEVTQFIDCILHGSEPRYGGKDGIREVAATLAAIRSAAEGRSVRVDEISDDFTAYR